MTGVPQLTRPLSVAAVLLCLWLLGALGFTVMVRLTGPHFFPSTDDLGPQILMLAGFYGKRATSFIPALYVASIVMAHSRFTRPYHVFTGIVAGWYLVSLLVRWTLNRPAFEVVGGSAPAVAFAFELLSVVVLAVAGMCFLYLNRRLFR